MMKRTLVFGLIACAFTALAWAQEAPEGSQAPEWDATSTKLLKDWEAKTYHLGRAGAEKASCKLAVDLQGPMTGSMSMNGTYKWDGASGSLEWDNSQLGSMLKGQGFSQDILDENFKEEAFLDTFRKCKLTAASTDDGTKITIEGENEPDFTAIHFDADGVMTKAVASVDPGNGQMTPVTISFEYGEAGGKVYAKTWTVEMDIPQMGKFIHKTEVTMEKVGEYWVTTKQHSTSNMGGQPMGTRDIMITDWKFNDDVE